MCTVSVVIPTYKHSALVAATLESVIAQTFSDYEVIVVNDGSPDETEQVLRPLIDSGKIRYICQSNRGQSAARNRGLAEAKGELIAFVDDDDLLPADKLHWQIELLREFPQAVLAYGECEVFGRRGAGEPSADGPVEDTFCGDHTQRLLELNHIISPGCTLIRAEALRKIGGFDEAIWGAEDWDLYLKLARQGPFAYRKRTALLYRRHDDNASLDFFRMYLNCCIVQKRHDRLQPAGRRPPRRPLNRRMRTHYCHECLRQAQASLQAGDLASGLSWWTRATRIDPAFVLNYGDVSAALVEAIFPQNAAAWLNRVVGAVRWRLRPVLNTVTRSMR